MEQNKYELVKFKGGEFELEVNVNPNEDTVWINQESIARLFETAISTVNYHIFNIYKENELSRDATFRKIRKVQIEGGRTVSRLLNYYNLDMVISIGYRVNSIVGTKFRIWANNVLKEYLLKGYVINENRVTVTNENFINLQNKVVNINNRLEQVEEKINNYELPLEKIFYNCEFYDAYSLLEQIFETANNKIVLIDNYIDRSVLDRLSNKKKDVNVIIYTDCFKSHITNNDINTFNKQYPLIKIVNTNKSHDRYIIVDDNKLYHCGASIKDAGKKIFSISLLDNQFIKQLINSL